MGLILRQNVVVPYLIFVTILTVERLFATFFRQKAKNYREKSQKLYQPILYVLIVGYCTAVLISMYEFLFLRDKISLLVSAIGLAILCLGIYVRNKAISTLDGSWSLAIEVFSNQVLITTGIYNKLAHPYYLAVVLELIGFSLVANAYRAVLFILFFQVPTILVRIFLEERVLLRKFGDRYVQYKYNTLL